MSARTLIGIAEYQISSEPDVILCAPNLGSCLGFVAYDSVNRVGGVAHCFLPLSKSDPKRADEQPAAFVDTGVRVILEGLYNLGAKKDKLLIYAAGAGQVGEKTGIFQIGKKNYNVFRKMVWRNSLLVKEEVVGSSGPTTICLNIGTGEVSVKVDGQHRILPGN